MALREEGAVSFRGSLRLNFTQKHKFFNYENPTSKFTMKLLKPLFRRLLPGLILSLVCISTGFAQISVSVRNKPIKTIIRQIEQSCDYRFFYTNSLPDLNEVKSLDVVDKPIKAVLDKLFKDTRIAYTIRDKQVTLSVTKAAATQAAKPTARQNREVSGYIRDKDGIPVIGVAVVQPGTSQGVTSDINGFYKISLQPDAAAVLEFYYLGYDTEKRGITPGTTSLDITMTIASTQVDEVVVVGYGVQKKTSLTGSVVSVKVGEHFNDRAISNVSSGLAGLVPGLAVAQASGEAGNNSAELLIRGMGTVNNAAPLIVVDGMPGLALDRLNMEDIESISVLKDASASAVYGARGANGVILVTTKTGKGVKKTQIRLSTSYAVSKPTNTFHFMTDYARALHLQQRRAGIAMLLPDIPYKDGTVDEWLAMQMIDPYHYPNTDWWDLTTRNGILKKYNLSATGSTEYSNFYASAGIQDETGQRINNEHQRYNARFNYDYKVRHNINVGVRFDGSWTKTQNASTGDMWTSIAGILPYDKETGRYGGPMAYGEALEVNNPLAMLNSTITRSNRQEANASAYVDWSPVKGLKATVDYVIHYQNAFTASAPMPTGPAWNFQTDTPTAKVYVSDKAGIQNNTSTGWKSQFSTRLDYNLTFAKHHDLSVMVLYNEESNFSRSLMASREERIDPSLSEINAALENVKNNSGNSARSGLRSYVGRLNYAAYDRYLLEFSMRYDGYSRFTRGHQWGFFPSVSAGWRFSEENFIKSWAENWLSNGKIRISYGALGNNTGVNNYEQLNTLTSTKYYVDGQVVSGFTSTKIINENLTWEKTTIFDVGIDLGFFNNRLTLEADYYNRLTTDMIQASQQSILLGGLTAPSKNVGSLCNRGVEITLDWKDSYQDFRYNLNFNISYNASQLRSWNEHLDTGSIYVGMPYNFTYMYHDTGYINQTWMDTYLEAPQSKFPGDLLLKDVNGDGQVNRYDMVAYPQYNQDRPTTNYGLSGSFSWKGLSLSFILQGTYGRKANWRTSYNNFNFPTTGYATTWDHWNKTWTIDNRDGEWPRAGGGQATANMETTSYWFDDLSYLRLKNLELAYSLPKKWLTKIGISSVRIYVSGSNLFTITSFRGLDPEKSNLNDLYPLNKTISCGINIGI